MACDWAPKKLLYQMPSRPMMTGMFCSKGVRAEMLVHLVRAGQQLLEVVHAQVEGDRQADRRPERIAPADPVPELEHVRAVSMPNAATASALVDMAAKCLATAASSWAAARNQCARRVGVGHRFLRGEGLGGHQEQRGFGVDLLERLDQVGAVDVGDEMDAQAGSAVGLQRLAHHLRAQVRAADADVDDVGDGACRCSPSIRRSGPLR